MPDKAGAETAEWSSDTAADFSRRSSLKSSIFELGLSRVGSPGPTFTENPLMMMEPIVRRDSSDSRMSANRLSRFAHLTIILFFRL